MTSLVPIGYLDRKRDRAYKQRVIVTPAKTLNWLFTQSTIMASYDLLRKHATTVTADNRSYDVNTLFYSLIQLSNNLHNILLPTVV